MGQVKVNGIILAAGYGTRLRPLTDWIPKPLIPVCHRPLLRLIADKMQKAGCERIAVNTHHLGEQISDYLKLEPDADSFAIFPEDEILGTGGPLVNAKEVLAKADCFILHNGDILSNVDLGKVAELHRQSGKQVTLVVLDGPENKVAVRPDGTIVDILGKLGREQEGHLLTYSGIAIFNPSIFKYLPEKPENCSIITAILDLMRQEPDAVGACAPEGIYWNDLGTVEKYFQVHEDILLEGKMAMPGKGGRCPIYCAPDVLIEQETDFDGVVVLDEDCHVGAGARLKNCLALPGTQVAPGSFHRNEILSPHGSIHRDIRELESLQALSSVDLGKTVISSLVEQGSDRRFYRVADADESRVLMISSAEDKDFERTISIGKFLEGLEAPTPKLFGEWPDEYTIMLEDLGNDTLYRRVALEGASSKNIRNLYETTVKRLAEFQLKATQVLENEDHEKHGIRLFEYEYLRWETDYFRENFLERHGWVPKATTQKLDEEFDQLAEEVRVQPQIFMHRDFQSQNIMVCGDDVRFVDYQGARIGPLGYDIMSLVNDPYVHLSRQFRQHLLKLYWQELQESNYFELDYGTFYRDVILAGLQRNMQALGAFTYLSSQKGKTDYLQFIPRGLEYLQEGLVLAQQFCPDTPLAKLRRVCEEVRI